MKGLFILMLFFAIIFLGCLIFYLYLLVNYGNLPPNEVPSWVHWFMLGGKQYGI